MLVTLMVGVYGLVAVPLGIHRVHSVYFSYRDAMRLGMVGVAMSVAVAIFTAASTSEPATLSVFAFPALCGLTYIVLASFERTIVRYLAWYRKARTEGPSSKDPKRAFLVGAGDLGESTLRQLQRTPNPRYHVVGIIDRDPGKMDLEIHGVQVLGSEEDIPRLAAKHKIESVLIAIRSIKGDGLRKILDICEPLGIPVLHLPSVNQVGSESQLSGPRFQEIRIEDLLRREPIRCENEVAQSYLENEIVLVTGGGGSIGSELVRQVVAVGPREIVICGKGENSVYEIEQEIIQTTGIVPKSVIADVRDRDAVRRLFEEYRPTVVFHAAAHKHVPLMQKNIREAVRNNVIGTRNVAEISVEYDVKRFILISTDKAVNPTSIMGATKRLCEMVIGVLGQTSRTKFAAVRFGNVLGSRGSLVPLLTAQIKRGGPVTLTHKDMVRFFMTIPEAVQLVLHAGALGEQGEIFILDMGEPMRIEDVAMDLIRLHGLVPHRDIEVKYTGIRPGEKLYEELVYDQEKLQATSHPKIRAVPCPDHLPYEELNAAINELVTLGDTGKIEDAQRLLMDLATDTQSAKREVISLKS